MDLSQIKLSKAEWTSIEVSVSEPEKEILQLIMSGYDNPEIRVNTANSLFLHMKIEPNAELEYYLYKEYFEEEIKQVVGSSKSQGVADSEGRSKSAIFGDWIQSIRAQKCKPLNKADMIRVGNVKTTIQTQKFSIFEFVLLDFCAGLFSINKKDISNSYELRHLSPNGDKFPRTPSAARPEYFTRFDPAFYLYSLVQFKKSSIARLNRYVMEFVDLVIANTLPLSSPATIRNVFVHATEYIEKNPHLIRYEDLTLYTHQKQLFRVFKTNPHIPKLVLYMAPTGTGKTLSPIGLAQHHRVIFVCVARHVGLALAKSAISVGKRVAFAFGCETASDIRLHYFAAKDYKINKRSGGIGKVDNSVGDKVEIMICDVASYITAMYYMLAFNDEHQLITYWDEPTITMDKDDDPLHEIIHRNWCENKISKVVLSCATLPKHSEISATLTDFQLRFSRVEEETEQDVEPEIHTIDSYDCKKTITMLNKEGRCVLPHLLFSEYRDVLHCVEHCERNKSLLRYFNVAEIVRFVQFAESSGGLTVSPESYFRDITVISMNTVKMYYIHVLKNIDPDKWGAIYAGITRTLRLHFAREDLSLRKIQSVGGFDSVRSQGVAESVGRSKPANSYELRSPSPKGDKFPRTPSAARPEYFTIFGRNEVSYENPSVSSGGGGGVPISRTTSMAPENSATLSNVATSVKTNTNASDGILLTTRDAHTLTDGPTIFLAEDVDKIGKFYIQQSKIPESVFQSIMEKIERNSVIQRKVDLLEKELADKKSASGTASAESKDRSKKAEREPMDKETQRFIEQINTIREQIQMITMNPAYIPNTKPHQDIWLASGQSRIPNAFVPNMDEEDVREIMGIDVDNQRKMLLILGIGVFSQQSNPQYAEIMKRLAYEQRLFLIIASSDYIYGTNYQFCHGFIGKDLHNMTQQKTIQAIGRIGRNNIQNEYTVRFRDDAILTQLFSTIEHNKEAIVMSRLFCEHA